MSAESKQSNSAAGFRLRACSPKQLSELYEVSAKTMKRWLEPIKEAIGERQGRYYNVSQIRRIVEHLGMPGCLSNE